MNARTPIMRLLRSNQSGIRIPGVVKQSRVPPEIQSSVRDILLLNANFLEFQTEPGYCATPLAYRILHPGKRTGYRIQLPKTPLLLPAKTALPSPQFRELLSRQQ